ncbi:AraC family transcriptional regulator [Xaviernesmea oryzae]|uniref:AraC family transcriptional regulator n=1 Tax=Xaviernesmea oryzae TaxID=464029 RepID=A0A1Q9AQM3_9HYPH|nr:AraC family transcriptional regulator [Xaviernesmea oryzae]OLP57733.1 AraC family transcriptional regulator [Xaviernesmea oryzae]SEM06040.1 Helix-turn-helix domain-containing protein [Xaviernesmea oryzae]
MQDLLDRMCQRVMRHTDGTRLNTPLPHVGLAIARQSHQSVMTLYEPMACLVLRGVKEVTIGDRVLRYDPASCFIASLDLPATGCIIEACADDPYIVASLALDRDLLSELLADLPPAPEAMPAAGFGVAPVTTELLEAWDHLLALLDRPGDIAFLAQSREREVLYQFLQGAHGPMLRQVAREDSRLAQVRRALLWIRDHYDETLRTETLADIAGMSVPTFHRHFKAVTAMSPLQYQKALRLQAARRMLTASGDATRVAYAVGYESPSQFSREYARLFGAPPLRDAERLRGGRVEAGELI